MTSRKDSTTPPDLAIEAKNPREGEPSTTVRRIVGITVAAAGSGAVLVSSGLVRTTWPDIAGVPGITAVALTCGLGCASTMSPHWPTMMRRVPGRDRLALTFDDGPDAEHTPRILDTLASAGARATFFVLGEQAERHPDLIRRMRSEGHVIGIHGWDHRPVTFLSPSRLLAGLRRSAALVQEASGYAVSLYRPPWGLRGPAMHPILHHLGWRTVGWRYAVRDWNAPGPATVVERFRRCTHARDIVLLHDAGPGANHTTAALPAILAILRERGLEPASIDGRDG